MRCTLVVSGGGFVAVSAGKHTLDVDSFWGDQICSDALGALVVVTVSGVRWISAKFGMVVMCPLTLPTCRAVLQE